MNFKFLLAFATQDLYYFGDWRSRTGKNLGAPLWKSRDLPADFWLPPRDSNPDKQIQNLLSYH